MENLDERMLDPREFALQRAVAPLEPANVVARAFEHDALARVRARVSFPATTSTWSRWCANRLLAPLGRGGGSGASLDPASPSSSSLFSCFIFRTTISSHGCCRCGCRRVVLFVRDASAEDDPGEGLAPNDEFDEVFEVQLDRVAATLLALDVVLSFLSVTQVVVVVVMRLRFRCRRRRRSSCSCWFRRRSRGR